MTKKEKIGAKKCTSDNYTSLEWREAINAEVEGSVTCRDGSGTCDAIDLLKERIDHSLCYQNDDNIEFALRNKDASQETVYMQYSVYPCNQA